MNQPHNNGSDELNIVGALSDGLANNATNDTTVDDGSENFTGGLANGDNRENDNSTNNSQDNDNNGNTSTKTYEDNDSLGVNVAVGISDDDTTTVTKSYSDDDTTTVSKSYSDDDTISKSYSDDDTITKTYSDDDTITKTYSDDDIFTKTSSDDDVITDDHSDDDVWQWSDSSTTTTSVAMSYSDSSSDDDFAKLDDLSDIGQVGVAGGNITFDVGDDFSFNLDVHDVNASAGAGYNIVQANNLADQDYAYGMKMYNEGANNNLSANAGEAYGAEGFDLSASCSEDWDLRVGDDLSAASTADASAILANSGFHQELIQGANLVSNSVDISVTGGDSSSIGDDAGA